MSDSESGPWRRRGPGIAALALLTAHLVLVLHGASRHSCTMDEIVYPTSGYAYLTTGDYRMNPEHPPLLKLWSGASWLGLGVDVRELRGWPVGDQWTWGQELLYGQGRPHEALLLRARSMIALFSVALAGVIFLAARRFAGDGAGLIALTLYAFDPLVIAHAGLATTDLGGAAMFFVTALALPRAVIRRGVRRIALAGALLGLALSAKFTNVLLFGVLGAVVALAAFKAGRARGLRAGVRVCARAGAIVAIGVVVLAATYGPAGLRVFLDGWSILGEHFQMGHQTYAFGQYSESGWWWYFPAAWAVKTPVAILVASAAGVLTVAALARRRPMMALVLLVPPALALGAAMNASLNIGVRHLLSMTPFLAVAGGLAGSLAWRSGVAGRVVVIAMAAWLAGGTLAVHPDEIAYANEAAGGPERLWRALTDSNVDWGQDLPALADEIGRHPLRRLYLSYFGSADPAAHGLTYSWIPAAGPAPRRYEPEGDPEGREWIAMSVTNLSDVFNFGSAGSSHSAHQWLRDRPFTSFPGHSIALWDITADGDAHLRVGRTAMAFNEPAAAEPALRRAVELLPDAPEVRLDLARVLAALGRFDEAAEQCAEAERRGDDEGTRQFCERVRAELSREP